MREALARVAKFTVRSPLPTTVYVFRNEESFTPYRDAVLGAPRSADGVFHGVHDGNYVLVQGDRAASVNRVIFHELTHYFVRNTVADLPLWFNEGLADFYSTFASSGDTVRVGLPIEEHLTLLRDHGFEMPLRELLAADVTSRNYNEKTRAGFFYAESWIFVHYCLLGDPTRSAQLQQYLALIAVHKPVDEAFTTAFGATFEQMTKELRAYSLRMRLPHSRITLADLGAKTIPAPHEVTRGEALFALGDVVSRTTRREDAVPLLEESLRLEPQRGETYAALARVKSAGGEKRLAESLFAKAVSVGSRDYRTFQAYGEELLDRIDRIHRAGNDPPAALLEEARRMFEKSIELQPELPRGLAGLGATYLFTRGDVSPGIAAYERSLAIAPAQLDVAANLVFLYARNRRRADAQRIYDTIIVQSADAETLATAHDNLFVADIYDAYDLLTRDKRKEALVILRNALPQVTSDQMKKQIEGMIREAEAPTIRLH
jgi:tetratricopeptide (TPR) repeat protein